MSEQGTGQEEEHTHEALEHSHPHCHVTHNYNERVGLFDHLSSVHEHEHEHEATAHRHFPHEDFEQEHRGEAHVHAHARRRAEEKPANQVVGGPDEQGNGAGAPEAAKEAPTRSSRWPTLPWLPTWPWPWPVRRRGG